MNLAMTMTYSFALNVFLPAVLMHGIVLDGDEENGHRNR